MGTPEGTRVSAHTVIAVVALLFWVAPSPTHADGMDCDIRMRASCGFGLDGKMPEGDSGQKEMAMMLCSPNCKKAIKSKDCKAAGWTKTHADKVLGNCKTLDEAKEKAKAKQEADPRQQEYNKNTDDAERKRKYAEGCRDMLSYECGVGAGGDQSRAMNLLCTPGCTNAIHSLMCTEAGITEEKIKRKSLCGDIDPKTKKPKMDSPQPILCQSGLQELCGLDMEGARADPASFNEDRIDHVKLCSEQCVELVNSDHCKAMNLDTSINSPDMCNKFKCKIGPSDEEACTADVCSEKCILNRPECEEIALQVGFTQVELAACALKRGDMTQEQFDIIKLDSGEEEAPHFEPSCIEHEKCGGGETFCNSECPLGSKECSGTRRTLGLGPRPWEVQCASELYGPKECSGFDEAATQVALECGMDARVGNGVMSDSMDVLCENIFGGDSDCSTMAQEKLMGYSLACMLNTERREEMLDGGLMYANADNMTSALVNLFFFQCSPEGTEKSGFNRKVWMQPGSYVVPYRAREGPRQPIEGSYTEVPDDEDEDLSKDADDEPFKMTEREEIDESITRGGDDLDDIAIERNTNEKDPMENENFKMRYELGELSDDELLDLKQEDLAEYLGSDEFDTDTVSHKEIETEIKKKTQKGTEPKTTKKKKTKKKRNQKSERGEEL